MSGRLGPSCIAVGSRGSSSSKYPDIGVIGDGTQLLMPGLVDAHSHGRGLSPIQKGVRNDFLENALFDWAYGCHLLAAAGEWADAHGQHHLQRRPL
jgi:imidazolonepropionase-like amidohydrolase